MDKCDCYIEDRQLVDYTPLMKPLYKTVSLCFGTREQDRCSCGGDRTKCDFYPKIREKAKKELTKNNPKIGEDYLIVTYDCSLPDAPTLCIGRTNGDNLKILNILHGDKALGAYALLTGYAEIKDNEE